MVCVCVLCVLQADVLHPESHNKPLLKVSLNIYEPPCVTLSVSQLPKSKDTSVMSGAGFKRLMVTVGSAVKSIATKKTDTDQV